MVGVFAVFATLSMLMFKQFGVGLATAILIDATIVRGVLLPATMKLLGDWNWYLPSWLEWLPRLDVSESEASARDEADSRLRLGRMVNPRAVLARGSLRSGERALEGGSVGGHPVRGEHVLDRQLEQRAHHLGDLLARLAFAEPADIDVEALAEVDE